MANNNGSGKSLESWIWDAACSIRGAKDAAKYKDYILPLIFTKRLCDVFDDELNRISMEVGSRKKAFQLVKADHKLVRFYLPLVPDDPEQPVWSVIRKLSDKIGEGVTTHMRAIARENPLLQGIIDRVDFNATTHGQRDLDDDRLSNLIEAVSTKRLGLESLAALESGNLPEFARLMDVHWQRKRERSPGMSNGPIDRWYRLAMENGALGGKLIGAGGGGFLLFYAVDKARLRRALRAEGLQEVRFRFDFEGTKVVAQN